MTDITPFSSKFIQTVGSILEANGFVLVEHHTGKLESLRYERQFRTYSRLQQIEISGNEMPTIENCIHIWVGSHLHNAFLVTLKELLPDYKSPPIRDTGCWRYTTEQELATCLAEIQSVVETYLLDWFENPVFNPSGVQSPHSPKQT